MVKLTQILDELKNQYSPKILMEDASYKLHFVNFDTLDKITVDTCLTTVELNKEVLSRGISMQVDLFITHHDLFSADSNRMIHGLRRQMIRAIMRHGIIVYTLGMSFMGVENGLSEALAAELKLTDYLLMNFRFETIPMGRIAKLPGLPFQDLIETAQKILNPPQISTVKGRSQDLRKVLILPGALGIDALKEALKDQIDGIVTGDFTYDVARLAVEESVSILGIGHICSKSPGMRNLAMNLAIKFKDTRIEFLPNPGLIATG